MIDTTDGETAGSTDTDGRATSSDAGAMEAVGTYEADDAVVFYDTENPLAWIQSRVTVTLEDAL